jgi:hypothetical protein
MEPFKVKGLAQIPDSHHILMSKKYCVLADLRKQLFVLDAETFEIIGKKQTKVSFLRMEFLGEDFLVTQSMHSMYVRDLKKGGQMLYDLKMGISDPKSSWKSVGCCTLSKVIGCARSDARKVFIVFDFSNNKNPE